MITFFDYITSSKDKELIWRTSPNGLKVFDTNNFDLLFKLDTYRIGLSGDITKPQLLFNTRIIAFSIIESHLANSKGEGI